eukprot:CAMPEP_0202449482 /NCGR_PEP_ID=MMETSP1360-20130828/8209_1 /ASSEMBLY_ACC=CAM_ASM_000848 /TAXON_ID=515479 /ORGANISM="Licmophora paradoxa, Strain CCMP2313" /LENGTH=186 /DNA_ID=CAMNT_0049067421 /DNA_START=616 /DNA_END=1176 /DNA_ORIENTATION=-
MSAEKFLESYDQAVAFLKSRVSFVFEKNGVEPEELKISTWSKYTTRSFILKHGTDGDKSKFPPETNRNRARPSNRKRKRPLKRNNNWPRRHISQQSQMPPSQSETRRILTTVPQPQAAPTTAPAPQTALRQPTNEASHIFVAPAQQQQNKSSLEKDSFELAFSEVTEEMTETMIERENEIAKTVAA